MRVVGDEVFITFSGKALPNGMVAVRGVGLVSEDLAEYVTVIHRDTRRIGEEMKIVNLTPHNINVYSACAPSVIAPETTNFTFQTIPASGIVCRIEEHREEHRGIMHMPVSLIVYGDVIGLPPEEDGTLYVVSLPCVPKILESGRTDIAVIDSPVRAATADGSLGAIIGCRGLALPRNRR